MAWRDNLRPASFRGVAFHVDTAGVTVGRRLARHEYPQRDVPFLEDMGRKAREYKIDAFVLGADYMTARDALIAALEEPGAGQLVHPYLGTCKVVVGADAQLTEGTRDGGFAKFSIVFIEAGVQQEPQAATDTERVLVDQYASSKDAFANDFALRFSADDQADFVVQDALNGINQLLQQPGLVLRELNYIRADGASPLNALLPENLPASLGDPLSLARGIAALVDSADGIVSLFDVKLAPVATSTLTPSRQQQSTNRTAINGLLQQTVTARRLMDLATSSPATLDEARAVRAEIVTRTDAILLDPTTPQATADAVVQLRTDAIQHFSRQTADLPRLIRVTQRAVVPAVVIAHDFYGDAWIDAERDGELVVRNRVRHPGFVPAGQPLQLIAV